MHYVTDALLGVLACTPLAALELFRAKGKRD